MSATAPRERRTGRAAGYIAAGAALILFSLGARDPSQSTSYQLGEVTGAVVVTLGVAAAIWAVVHFLVRRRAGKSFLSPWIVVIAAFLALAIRLAAVGRELEQGALVLVG